MSIESSTSPSIVAAHSPRAKAAIPWGMVGLIMAIPLVSHMNRLSMAAAYNSRIKEQYGIAPDRMGMVYTAFLLTYTLSMIPGGLLIDRVGARGALLIMLAGSAIFAALTGAIGLAFASGGAVLAGLLIIRSLMGILSAPLHPGCARAVCHWVPPRARSWTNGMVNGSALFGIAITPLGFGALIDRYDWPGAFLIMAGVTTLLAVTWSFSRTDRSTRVIDEGPGRAADRRRAVVQEWLALLRDQRLILLTASYAAIGYCQYLFFYWLDYYFGTVQKLPPSTSRLYSAIPPLAMAVGMPLGGWLSDKLEHAGGGRRRRKLIPFVGMLAGALLVAGGILTTNPAWIVTWFALALGAVGMAEGPFWASAVEFGGRRGGSAAAILNAGGNAVGGLAPYVTPVVGEMLGWEYAVALGSLSCLLGAILWLMVDLDERPAGDVAST